MTTSFTNTLQTVSDFVTNTKAELKAWARNFESRNPNLVAFLKGVFLGYVGTTAAYYAVFFTVLAVFALAHAELLLVVEAAVLAYATGHLAVRAFQAVFQ